VAWATACSTPKQRLEANPSGGGERGVLVKFNANLAVALNSALNLNVGVIDTYNSEPAEGTKGNDLGVFTGLKFRFGP
jgi:putative salt-induced outer membrane protein YdiY